MSEEKKKQRWFPLESNPALINGYIEKLGYDTSLYEVCFENSMQSWLQNSLIGGLKATSSAVQCDDTVTDVFL